jgi:DNA-binding transcriptional MerR regulator
VAWSTSELAKLAGTTVNTIRHYHRLGLLEEPDRRHNGYKQYETVDLVRLLHIRRLVELGVPLSRIKEPSAGFPEALQQVDLDHAAAIERLEKARQSIAAILSENAPPDTPPGFEPVAGRLSEADRSLIQVYTQVLDDQALADVRRAVENDNDDAINADFELLPADADEATRQNLAEKYAPFLVRTLRDFPWMDNDAMDHVSKGKSVTRQTFVDALRELHNEAQLDVIHRAKELARRQLRAEG